MLRLLVVSLLSCTVLPAAATVVAVELGPQGAEVTRELAAQPGEVVVPGFPASLNIAGVRIEADTGIRVESMRLRAEFDAGEQQDRRTALQQQLHDVEDQLALLDREAEDRALTRTLLGRVGTGEQGVGEVKNTVLQVRDALYRIAKEATEARATRRTLNEERAALQTALKNLGRSHSRTQSLVLDIAGGDGTLRLRYPVQQARFEVRYRLRLDSAAQSVQLEPRLLVRQNTGTDWNNVRLTAATTKPSYRLQVPDPHVPVLRPRAPMQERQRSLRGEAMSLADTAVAGKSAMPTAAIQATVYDIRLELPGRVDVPSDDRPRPFALPTMKLDASVHARITPQRDAAAYVHAEWTMPAGEAIVAGAAEVMRDAVIVGRSRLPQLLPGQTHAQGFGVDPALEVNVERAPIRRDESFFGGTQRWLQVQTVRVESAHAKPVDLRMIDSVPVAGDDAIRVELSGDAPTKRDIDDRQGVHLWQTTLAPGGEQLWRKQVTISAPADMDLGL